MRRVIGTVGLVLLLVTPAAFAQVDELIERADALYEEEAYEEAISELERGLRSLRSDRDRGEVLWRISRATMQHGATIEFRTGNTDRAMELYEEAERIGQEAIDADPGNHNGYFWKSAAIGRAAQVRGVLNSLFKAGEMRDLLHEAVRQRPDHVESFYVLSQMYRRLPGIISFGNVDFAVSLARKALDLQEAEMDSGEREEPNHDVYTQLAAALIARNWNENRRNREQSGKENRYRRERDVLEKNFRYEGTVDIPRMSDRQEAERILDDVIRRLRRIRDRTRGQDEHLEEALSFRDEL